MASSLFFADGIRFACTDCGQCCTGSPGIVAISDAESVLLADRLKTSIDDLREHYLMPHDHGWRLREKDNGDCLFFDGRCTIYAARPRQCRTYPFWFKNLRSPEAWCRTCRDCPGIGQGRLYKKSEILHRIEEELEERPWAL